MFYTAPTLIRSLMQSGDDWVKAHDRGSLRVLGTVGEPIGEHAWNWFGARSLCCCHERVSCTHIGVHLSSLPGEHGSVLCFSLSVLWIDDSVSTEVVCLTRWPQLIHLCRAAASR